MNPLPSPGAPASTQAGHYGLSWAAFFNRWLFIGLAIVILGVTWWLDLFESISNLPYYWVLAGAAGFIWWPYMIEVHRRNMIRLVVYDAPNTLTLYRVGQHVPGFEITGSPVPMISRTGFERLFVTDFDPVTAHAQGAAVDGMTALDYLRDLRTFDRLSRAYCSNLEEDRLALELVAVRTQEAIRVYAERWVNIGIAAQDPAPIEAELIALQESRREEEPEEIEGETEEEEGEFELD